MMCDCGQCLLAIELLLRLIRQPIWQAGGRRHSQLGGRAEMKLVLMGRTGAVHRTEGHRRHILAPESNYLKWRLVT